MATKRASKKPTKTSFVLSLPRDLPAAAVIEKARAAGIKVTENYVHKIRSKAKVAGGGKKQAKGKPGPKKKGGKGSASDFVRKYPSKSANEIAALAKKAGVKMSVGLVYTTRAYDKKKKGGTSKTKGKRGSKTKTPVFQVFPGGGGGGSEAELKQAALAVGFPRALKVVEDLSRKFEAVQKQYQALLG